MQEHSFILILSGISGLTPELADTLYEAAGGDIELNMVNGVAYIEATRLASTLKDAILSAINDVEGAKTGVRVVRVETETANTVAKINAELLGMAV
jgi:hypothetical protein